MKNLKLNKRIFIIISLVAMLLSGISMFTNSYTNTEAFGACKAVGSFMGRNEVSDGNLDAANAKINNKKWTVEELFRKSVSYSSFYGEGSGTWFYAEKKNRGENVDGWNSDIQNKIESTRSFSCFAGKFDGVPQVFLSIASGITWITGLFVSMFLGQDYMSNILIKIIGGEGTSDGLISTFLNSFYMPLVVLAVLFMVVTIIYKGLIQMKMREALNSIIWSSLAFIIGVTLMLSPQLITAAPQAITSTITSCVLGALSGQNCFNDNIETPSILAGNECISTFGGANANNAESIMSSLNCTIWKAFVLEPWAEEQFGEPYKNLYTSNAPPGGQIWRNLPEGKGEKYCISLTSSKSYTDSVVGTTPNMDLNENVVCNVAIYHLFIKTDMRDSVFQRENNYNVDGVLITDDTGTYDSRWYDIIIPMAGDESNWRNWAGEGRFLGRISSSIMSVIAVTAASSVLFTLAIFGGAYKVIGLILMAFAPLFLLFAIEPTKGRRIFLGWLETLVSSFLKYFAIAVLIVVALTMYAGLLSNTSGPTSLVGVIVLTVALHMYRKEIVDLIGVSNMGGERLSNKAGKLAEKIKEKGKAFAGGAIGGAIGNMSGRKERVKVRKETISDLQKKLSEASSPEEKEFYQKELNEEEKALKNEDSALYTATSGLVKGGSESVERSMKRGNGLASNIFQQSGRTSADIKRKDKEDRKEAAARRTLFESRLANTSLPDLDEVENTTVENKVSPSEAKRNNVVGEIVESQRQPVEYKGNLSPEEKAALDDFADKLKKSAADSDLAALAEDEELLRDENKKSLVANEINARLQANTMIGIASNELSRTNLTDNKSVSEEELRLNVQVHLENFLETGDEKELQKHLAAREEVSQRTNVEFDLTKAEERLREFKDKVGDNYERKESIPTNEDLAKGEIVEVKINGKDINLNNVTAPETMSEKIEQQKDKISEVKSLNEVIQKEKEQKQNPIPINNSQSEQSRNDSNQSNSNGSQGTTVPNQQQEKSVNNSNQSQPSKNSETTKKQNERKQDSPRNDEPKAQEQSRSKDSGENKNNQRTKPVNTENVEQNSFDTLLEEMNSIDDLLENPVTKPQDSRETIDDLLDEMPAIDDLLDEMMKENKDK